MNYGHISQAVDFYRDRGYVYLDDAPWYVGRAAYHCTKPPGSRDMHIFEGGALSFPSEGADNRYIVASGEQSFVQMMLNGQSIKRAVCVTPCFRAEPTVDMLHRKYFMKAELINAHDVDEGHLMHMIHEACSFFEQFVPVRVAKTLIGYDIIEKGTQFELGSYGIREVEIVEPGDASDSTRLRWIYGTACAEPRLSTAIAKHSKSGGR